jgi:hypothetical protein
MVSVKPHEENDSRNRGCVKSAEAGGMPLLRIQRIVAQGSGAV